MGKNPFHEDLDDTFRGVRVRVRTSEHTYEGWCGRWHYNEHGVIVYDAERNDGEKVGAVTVSNPETVERLPPTDPIEEVRVADIAPSPYTYRSMDDAAHEKFVKLTRERGHLLTYPTVRRVGDDEHRNHDSAYEVVAGHRRFETARRANLDTITARVADLDAWEAVEQFVDDHVPIQGGDERHMYGQEEIDRMLARLREDWDDDRLREIGVLAPYLEEKLASTRREGIRQGYLADSRGSE
ncbi:ParB/RepB/Spo0J family partition protein [Halococcus sp. AFM35]|uniref:ParB/RepB/Spo0J family partition protein n=1 Tax=Halococcus sp. AFM35 TaxID=3421653 RepID=UPI003EC0DCF2